jgi:hypothetical protein
MRDAMAKEYIENRVLARRGPDSLNGCAAPLEATQAELKKQPHVAKGYSRLHARELRQSGS